MITKNTTLKPTIEQMHCCIHYDYTSLLVKFYNWIISFIRPWKSAFLLRYSFPGLRHESLIRLLVVPGQCNVFATAYSQLDCICKRAIIKDEGSVIMPCKCNKDEDSWLNKFFTYWLHHDHLKLEVDAEPCMSTLKSANGTPWEQIFTTNRPSK